LVAAIVGSGTLTWPVPSAWAQAQAAGEVVVVEADNLAKELTGGGSATVFTLRLPDGASCPGDSANDQYRVQSFIVPSADDPGIFTYGSIKPDGEGRWALYGVDTRPFVHALTERNDGAGLPGRIGGLPPLSFAVFPPGELPEGAYRIGVACTRFRKTERYWDTELMLLTGPDDEPGQLRWHLASVDPSSGDGSSGATGLALVAAAAALVAFLARRSTRRRAPLVSKEGQ
jgi:hypothetical protein